MTTIQQFWVEDQVHWRVEIALASAAGGDSVWDTALWDTGVWAGNDLNWIVITDDAEDVRITYGRDTFRERMRTGTCRITLANDDGQWNPDAGAIPPGDLTLRPGRFVRVSADAGQGYVNQWTGYIDSLDETYAPGGANILTVILGYDFQGNFARNDPPALPVEIPAGQLTSERVASVLEEYGLDGAYQGPGQQDGIQVGTNTMQASTLARSSLEEMQKAAQAEGSVFFIDAEGLPVFKNIDWLTTDPRSTTIQALYGFRLVPQSPRVVGVDSLWSAQLVLNDAQFAAVGSTVQRVSELTSWSLYQPRTIRILDFENDSDVAVLDLAQRVIDSQAFDRLRVRSLELSAANLEQARVMLDTNIGDLVRAQVETLHGWSYTVDAHVNGISHHVTGSDWTMTVRLDDAATTLPPGTPGAFDEEAFTDGFLVGNV